MQLVILFGPHAVGKMTVGQELCRMTGLKLFHNHMTIEALGDLFVSHPVIGGKLVNLFREEVFLAFRNLDEKGMVFTYMWALDAESDWAYVRHVEELFSEVGADVYYVELEAEEAVRRERNRTENRLMNKPSKRKPEHSDVLFSALESRYRLNSLPGEIQKTRYMRLNNTNLSPEEAAKRICEHFGF
ncbi:MAG: shikimate kinase [Clostridiales bacterium]|nr:shikimate kinase [Clostridiales bacterium]